MRSDQYRNIVLTVIAVCLSILTLSVIGLPNLATRAEATIAPTSAPAAQAPEKPGGEVGVVRAPAATLPLRWRVPTAFEDVSTDTFCSTVISVRNLTSGTVNLEVEWIRWDLNITALRPKAIWAYQVVQWVTNSTVNIEPNYPDDDAGLADLPAALTPEDLSGFFCRGAARAISPGCSGTLPFLYQA